MSKLLKAASAALAAWTLSSAKALALTVTLMTTPLSTTTGGPNFPTAINGGDCAQGSTIIVVETTETNSGSAKPTAPNDSVNPATSYSQATASGLVIAATPQMQLGVWYLRNIPSTISNGTNITFNYAGAPSVARYAAAFCVTGLDQFTPLDLDSGGGTPFTGTVNSGAGATATTLTIPKPPGPPTTLTYPDELLLAFVWVQGGGSPADTWGADPDSSWHGIVNVQASNVRAALHIGWKESTGTPAVNWNPTDTNTSGSAHSYIGAYDTFVVSGQALTPHGHPMLMSGGAQ